MSSWTLFSYSWEIERDFFEYNSMEDNLFFYIYKYYEINFYQYLVQIRLQEKPLNNWNEKWIYNKSYRMTIDKICLPLYYCPFCFDWWKRNREELEMWISWIWKCVNNTISPICGLPPRPLTHTHVGDEDESICYWMLHRTE